MPLSVCLVLEKDEPFFARFITSILLDAPGGEMLQSQMVELRHVIGWKGGKFA